MVLAFGKGERGEKNASERKRGEKKGNEDIRQGEKRKERKGRKREKGEKEEREERIPEWGLVGRPGSCLWLMVAGDSWGFLVF